MRSKYGLQLAPRATPSCTLLPLLYWSDRTHVCESEHYRRLVFGADTLVRTGTFIEDCFGLAMLEDIKSRGLAAHAKYAAWLLMGQGGADEGSQPYIGHLDGRTFRAHRLVLVAGSEFFGGVFRAGMAERASSTVDIAEPSLGAASVEAALEFLYTGGCDISEALLQPVLEAAAWLGIDALRDEVHLFSGLISRLALGR